MPSPTSIGEIRVMIFIGPLHKLPLILLWSTRQSVLFKSMVQLWDSGLWLHVFEPPPPPNKNLKNSIALCLCGLVCLLKSSLDLSLLWGSIGLILVHTLLNKTF